MLSYFPCPLKFWGPCVTGSCDASWAFQCCSALEEGAGRQWQCNCLWFLSWQLMTDVWNCYTQKKHQSGRPKLYIYIWIYMIWFAHLDTILYCLHLFTLYLKMFFPILPCSQAVAVHSGSLPGGDLLDVSATATWWKITAPRQLLSRGLLAQDSDPMSTLDAVGTYLSCVAIWSYCGWMWYVSTNCTQMI